MKTMTKKASKKTATKSASPSADASPRHKALIAAAQNGRGAPPPESPAVPTEIPTAPPADPYPTEPEEREVDNPFDAANDPTADYEEALDIADDAVAAAHAVAPTPREVAAESFVSREPATPPAWFPASAALPAPFATLQDLGATWIKYLEANGATTSTWSSYARDLDLAYGFLGAATDPAKIGLGDVTRFESSPAVNIKKNGAARALPTILKTKRVLRMAFAWAVGAGRAPTTPYAKA